MSLSSEGPAFPTISSGFCVLLPGDVTTAVPAPAGRTEEVTSAAALPGVSSGVGAELGGCHIMGLPPCPIGWTQQ